MCFYVTGLIENMHKVFPELNQISCDCEERHYFKQNKNTQRIFIEEPREKKKAIFIDKITPNTNKWQLKVKNLYLREYENQLRWDQDEVQLYHPIEDEDSKVLISGRQYFLHPEYKKGKKCLCFWGINKMFNGKE